MALWDLITVWNLAMPVGGAIASARHGQADVAEFAAAIVSGVAVGLVWTWAMRRASEGIVRLVERRSATAQERYLAAMYLAALCWAWLGLIPGMWVAARAIQLLR
jgi:hypothetical protein